MCFFHQRPNHQSPEPTAVAAAVAIHAASRRWLSIGSWAAIRTFIHLIALTCCFTLCERVLAFSTVEQLTRTNIQNFPFITVNAHAEKDGKTQFEVTVEFFQKEQPSACFYGTLELMDGKRLIASSSVRNARPRAPAKFLESNKKQIPLIFTFTVSQELLPDSKFTIEHLFNDNIGDVYWFYLHDFKDTKSLTNQSQSQPPWPLRLQATSRVSGASVFYVAL
jgi:hypothetical protein